jgi:hypothetical protein
LNESSASTFETTQPSAPSRSVCPIGVFSFTVAYVSQLKSTEAVSIFLVYPQFIKTQRDAVTGELLTPPAPTRGDFIAVGYEADGRRNVRPIEDMATAGVS